MSKSRSVVSFIANLMPSYHGRSLNDVVCAESLDDGTLIIPDQSDELDRHDDGWVFVRWQGDAGRQSEVLADSIATVAVVRHVQLHYAGQPIARMASEIEGLSQHYEFKTGGHLYLPYERAQSGLVSVVNRALGRLGEAAVIEVLKKSAGL